MDTNLFKLGIIGAGNMAWAIVKGALSCGVLKQNEIIISDVDAEKLKSFEQLGVKTTNDNKLLSSSCSTLLFAVKPQSSDSVMNEIKDAVAATTIISIMAGIPIAKLKNHLGNRAYVRVMPNTPALIGKGMSVLAYSAAPSPFARQLFAAVGEVAELDEGMFDAVTSVSGSGPAYVYLFLKAMADGGVEGGLPLEIATKLAVQTAIGAAHMIASSDKTIDSLIEAVCSKGGTTIEAIESFKSAHIEDIIKEGIAKCRERSKELSNQAN